MTLPASQEVDIQELIERVEKATGPDRELDGAISWALDYLRTGAGRVVEGRPEYNVMPVPGCEPDWRAFPDYSALMGGFPAHYTASLDAALALVERALPGACWRVECAPPAVMGPSWRGPFWASCGLPGEQESATATTGPLALLSSLLRALQAREGK